MGWTFNPFTGRLDATGSLGSLSGIVTSHGHLADYITAGTFGSVYGPTNEQMIAAIADRDFSAASNWANVDLDDYNETGKLIIWATAPDTYCTLPVASAPTVIGNRYRLTFHIQNLSSTWSIRSFDGNQTIGSVTSEGSKTYDFTATTAGGLRVVALYSDSGGEFDDFSLLDITQDYIFPAKVGIGSLATPGVVPVSLHIAETYNVSFDPWVYKLWIQGDLISGTLQEDGGYVGLLIQPDTTALDPNGFAYEMYGIRVLLPPLMATSTCTAVTAIVNNSQAVTMASGRAVDATIYNLDAGGSITNARAYNALIDTGLGTMSRGYLFYGEYSGAGTVTDKWGIYLDGEDKNYLDGKVGIGVWPEWKLHVSESFNLDTLPTGDNSSAYIYTLVSGSAGGVPTSTGIHGLSISAIIAGDFDSGEYLSHGLYNNMVFQGENFGNGALSGIRNDMWIYGTSNTSELVMWESLFWHLGTGEIADVIGCAITIGINGGGSIPLSYIYYGVYSDGSGTMSEKWGIYIAGADYNYLSGLLEVDNLSPLNLTDTFIPFFNAAAGLVDSILSQPHTQGLVIGVGEAAIDYTLTFDGETNDGVITWMEDEDVFTMACGLGLDAGSILNWGATLGASGYGIRDNAGEMEYKDSGDSWIAFNSLGGSASIHFYFPSGW